MTDTAKLYEELRSIIDGGSESFTHDDAVQYLKDKLAQPEQEPVAYPCIVVDVDYSMDTAAILIQDTRDYEFNNGQYWLTTTPPQRTWVELSEEQKRQLNESLNLQGRFPIIDAIEAVCKGNNT